MHYIRFSYILFSPAHLNPGEAASTEASSHRGKGAGWPGRSGMKAMGNHGAGSQNPRRKLERGSYGLKFWEIASRVAAIVRRGGKTRQGGENPRSVKRRMRAGRVGQDEPYPRKPASF